MRHQIALAVALLGISSMLCLELMKKVGRRLEEQQLPANEVEALVKKALTIPKEPVEVRRGRVKKYLPVYLVCNVLGAVEALAVWNLGWVSEKMGTLLWVSCFFGFFFSFFSSSSFTFSSHCFALFLSEVFL